MEPPTGPSHIVRAHCASGAISITSLYVSLDNERIYSADASGLVVVTSTRTLRPLFTWTAHASASVLGVQEWGDAVITHGRDNQLHVWDRFESDHHAQYDGGERSLGGGSAALSTSVLPVPRLLYSLDVNALNYCRFSMLSGSLLYESEKDDGSVDSGTGHERALIAVPNLVDSALADVWELPSKTRVHAAIGKADPHTRERGTGATGILMSLHLYVSPVSARNALHVLAAYENGSVACRRHNASPTSLSVEGRGWELLWTVKLHVESIMALTVSPENSFALSVSADHLIVRYDLATGIGVTHRTKHPGNACIAIRDGDGRLCAVGGWDGRIRLYSTKSFKPLGTLSYHKETCQAVVFAHALAGLPPSHRGDSDEEMDEMDEGEQQARARWVVGGGKEGRMSIWALGDFAASK